MDVVDSFFKGYGEGAKGLLEGLKPGGESGSDGGSSGPLNLKKQLLGN